MKTTKYKSIYRNASNPQNSVLPYPFIIHHSSFIIKKRSSSFIIKFLLFLLFTGNLTSSTAQQYPVQGSLIITSPYPSYLSDYANPAMDKLILNLVSTDISLANQRVRMKVSISKGTSLMARSSDAIINEAMIMLDGGVPIRLTSAELANYFKLDNLQAISPNAYSQTLPEGVYTITFQVFDYFTGNKLSGDITQQFWLMLNDPPLLNTPFDKENIQQSSGLNPQIAFQWTPRSTQVSNTEYEFTLVELWDDYGDPYQQFLASTPKYKTTTNNTTLLYGITEPPLIPGRRYAWRVQAKAKQGLEDIGLYRNDGYSNIYTFKYAGQCEAIQTINGEVKGSDRIYMNWQQPPATLNLAGSGQSGMYKIAYRKYTSSNQWEWVEMETTNGYINLTNLDGNTEYEIKVGNVCDNSLVGYSQPIRLRTKETGTDLAVNCGQAPSIDISNKTLLQKLSVYDVITATDFPVTITRAEGNANGWSGEGWVKVPYLADTKIHVLYKGIKVNTDYKLIDGYFETAYNANWKNIGDIDQTINSITGDPVSVGILRGIKDHIPDAKSAPIEELTAFSKQLSSVDEETIKNTLVLSTAEKTQLKQDIAAMAEATKTLENPNATPEQKEKAEEQLRKAAQDAGPILKKLGEGVGKGLVNMVGKWFDNIRSFIKGYKGTIEDQQQAGYWHTNTDSIVAVIQQRKDVPDSLMKRLDTVFRAAQPAWTALEKGSMDLVYNNVKHGPYWQNEEWENTGEALQRVSELVDVIEAIERWRSADVERLKNLIDYDKLVKWLKENNGKTVPYHFKDFISDENSYQTGSLGQAIIVPLGKTYSYTENGETKTLQLSGSLSTEDGSVTLVSSNTMVPVAIDFNGSKIVFNEDHYFDGKPKGDINNIAIRLTTNKFADIDYLLRLQGYKYGEAAQQYYNDVFKKGFEAADGDCNKLDVLYEELPSFIKRSDEEKLKDLRSLSKCWIDTKGTNEENAVLNLLKSFGDQKWLYNQLYVDKKLASILYQKMDGDNALALLEIYRILSEKSGRNESTTSNFIYIGQAGEAYSNDNFLHGYPYILTDASGPDRYGNLSLNCVIGRPNIISPGSIEVRKPISSISSINPLDRIKVLMDEPGNLELLPAIYAYHLGIKKDREELLGAINKASIILGTTASARILFGANSSIAMRVLATLQLTKTSLDVAMSDKKIQEELEKSEEGKWIKQKWPIISIATDVTLLSADILSGLAKNGQKAAAHIRDADKARYEKAAEDMEELAQKAGNNVVNDAVKIATATKAITKSKLPNEFVDALKGFGKSEDDILEYFTEYHNVRSSGKFLNEIEYFLASSNIYGLTRSETFSLWGYTTNYYFRDLNKWLRNGEKILQTADLKNLINSGLAKLPNYSGGNIYRGIVIESESLQDFLNSYKTGAKHTWDDFTSCGGSQAASFGGRPEVNIIFEIQHTTGKEISNLADGIMYGAMPRPEILIKAGSKFQAAADPIFDATIGKWKIKLIQTQ